MKVCEHGIDMVVPCEDCEGPDWPARAVKAEDRVAELETCLRAWDALFVWDPFDGYDEELALHVVFHRADVPSVRTDYSAPASPQGDVLTINSGEDGDTRIVATATAAHGPGSGDGGERPAAISDAQQDALIDEANAMGKRTSDARPSRDSRIVASAFLAEFPTPTSDDLAWMLDRYRPCPAQRPAAVVRGCTEPVRCGSCDGCRRAEGR